MLVAVAVSPWGSLQFLPASKVVVQVACGSGHTVALTDEGCVYTWGRGDDGRLGRSKPTTRTLPLPPRHHSPHAHMHAYFPRMSAVLNHYTGFPWRCLFLASFTYAHPPILPPSPVLPPVACATVPL